MVTLMAKQIFHHAGVSPSMTPAMRSESQPMLRWLATNGTRSNSAGGACTLMPVVELSISAPFSALIGLRAFLAFGERALLELLGV
jgi:hypothetical protein